MKIRSRFAKATIAAGKPVQLVFDANEVPEGILTELMALDDDARVTLDIQPEQSSLEFDTKEDKYVNN